MRDVHGKVNAKSVYSRINAEAVRLAKTGNGNIAATARDLGIDVTTLRDWLRRANAPEPDLPLLSPSEEQELLQLRRDVTVLRMEREILKNPPRGSTHLWKEKLLWCYPRFDPEGAAVCFLVTIPIP